MIRLVSWIALSISLALSLPVRAEEEKYTLQRGDRIALRILSVADLSVQATIDLDGKVSLPFIGEILAESRTISDLKDQVSSALNGQVHRYVNREGIESFITIGKEDVQLVVAEYRPISVYGTVLTQGQIPFRPGMTVRSALAVAGLPSETAIGKDAMTALRAADLQGEVRALKTRRDHQARVRASLVREAQQLGGDTFLNSEEIVRALESPDVEGSISNMRVKSMHNRIELLSQSVESIDERLAILNEREVAESEALAEETKVKQRIDDLFSRGIVNLDRMSDVNRSQLFIATRLLQTQDAIMQNEMDRENFKHQKEQSIQDRLIELAQQIEESEMESGVLNAQLTAANQALSVLGVSAVDESQLLLVKIHRGSSAIGVQSFRASMDDPLQPGDILEVSYEANNR